MTTTAIVTMREIATTRVLPDERDIAARVAGLVCQALSLPRGTLIRWFTETNGLDEAAIAAHGCLPGWETFELRETAVGRMQPLNWQEIWVRPGRGVRETANTVAHELRHLWQWRTLGAPTGEQIVAGELERRERDAREFAALVVEVLARNGVLR